MTRRMSSEEARRALEDFDAWIESEQAHKGQKFGKKKKEELRKQLRVMVAEGKLLSSASGRVRPTRRPPREQPAPEVNEPMAE